MAYLKPPMFTRALFNPVAMRYKVGGAVALTVPRASTGTDQRIPVIPVEVDGQTYLVSTRGESAWVRNVRTAGRLALGDDSYTAEELAVTERSPIIEAYRKVAGRTVEGYWKKLPDPADHPVFRLVSASPRQPAPLPPPLPR